MILLGIESSCDETAAAVVENGTGVLSNVVASQNAIHSPYGGVVPELAARRHVEVVLPVIEQAMAEASLDWDGIDAIAVTKGPGLIGALLIGLSAAKALAYALDKPMVAVNHLEGHMHAAFLENGPLPRPFVCLVVSGGHTALYHAHPDGSHQRLGTTLDDAAGEAFDKVAKLLDLGYPGGVVIDRLAKEGGPAAIEFPRALPARDSLDFSFSGVKTAVVNFVRKHGDANEGSTSAEYRIEDIVASFQEAVVDVLALKTLRAAERAGVKDIAVVGGVAANSRLRQRLKQDAGAHGFTLHLPPIRYCTDNAVMIAAAGYSVWKRSGFCQDPLELDAVSRWM